MMKFLCGGASWTLDSHDSMKIPENTENVLPGLRILLHPNTMYTRPMVTHFVAVVNAPNEKIFSRSSHPDIFFQEKCSEIFGKLTGKYLYKDA